MGAKIYNKDAIQAEIRSAGIVGNENIPGELADKVLPVIDITPRHHRLNTVLATLLGRTTTGTGVTVLAAQGATKEVYITGYTFANVQDATSDNTVMSLTSTFGGVAKVFHRREKPTTTASVTDDFVSFPIPLKIDDNTAVTFTLAFTVGTSTSDVILFGYIVDKGASV